MNPSTTKRNAFTLVEVLVVLVLLSMMAAMVVTALQGVTQMARMARTRSIIAAIDTVVQERYEAFKYRPLPIAMPNYSKDVPVPPPGTGTITLNFEVLAYEAARVRLIMTRDIQRMELPDKRLDVVSATDTIQDAMTIKAVANRVIADASGHVVRKFDERDELTVPWDAASKIKIYFDRFEANGLNWTTEHEGAECLYIIMATSFIAGSPAIARIPSSNIGDTDSDGMPEILDAWGTPLGFVRWPVGYSDPTGTLDTSLPDDFDPFRSDFGFHVSSVDEPWSIRPLILSAGSDGEFGVALSGSTDHRTQTWPLTQMGTTNTLVGDDKLGRTTGYPYPDPYLRQATLAVLPGEQIAGSDAYADDITNFALKVSR